MENGRVSDSSSSTQNESLSARSPYLDYLHYDHKKSLFIWKGTPDDLKSFCHEVLNITESFTVSANGRSTVIKNKQVSFNLFTSTKTLQVQGVKAQIIKNRLKSLLQPDDQLNQVICSDFKRDGAYLDEACETSSCESNEDSNRPSN